MKIYNITPPLKENYCVPSCLQAILKDQGYEVFQKDIAQKLIKKEEGFLPEGRKLEDFLSQKGLSYEFYWHNETPFNEPDMLLNQVSIKNILIGIDNHAFLLQEFKDPVLFLIDPNNSQTDKRDYSKVLREMKKTRVGFFGLVSSL